MRRFTRNTGVLEVLLDRESVGGKAEFLKVGGGRTDQGICLQAVGCGSSFLRDLSISILRQAPHRDHPSAMTKLLT